MEVLCCISSEKYAMLFDEPVLLQASQWYVAWARISGPSSDCGSNGQTVVTTDDQSVLCNLVVSSWLASECA